MQEVGCFSLIILVLTIIACIAFLPLSQTIVLGIEYSSYTHM
ncbi:MAG: hypothetical protein ACNA7U_03255 [Candidatus Izemoplasmataceae bacterium]|jgi:hypothetical protein